MGRKAHHGCRVKAVECLPNIHDLLGAGMRLLIALSYVPLRSRVKGLGLETSGLT